MMNSISDHILDQIRERLVSELNPDQIYLFGSAAWGTPAEGSDLDLLVIVPEGRGPTRNLKLRARRCLRDISVPIDIIIETDDIFESRRRVHSSLESLVAERGKKLHG